MDTALPNLTKSAGALMITGDIVFATVPALHKGLVQMIASDASINKLDLAGASRIDSSGMALFINILSQENNGKPHLALVNVPHSLIKLAKLSGAQRLLGLQ